MKSVWRSRRSRRRWRAAGGGLGPDRSGDLGEPDPRRVGRDPGEGRLGPARRGRARAGWRAAPRRGWNIRWRRERPIGSSSLRAGLRRRRRGIARPGGSAGRRAEGAGRNAEAGGGAGGGRDLHPARGDDRLRDGDLRLVGAALRRKRRTPKRREKRQCRLRPPLSGLTKAISRGTLAQDPRFPAAMDDVRFFHQQAEKCRAAAVAAENEHARRGLQQLASHYEREARRLNLAEIQAR